MKRLKDLRKLKDRIDAINSEMQQMYKRIDDIDVELDGVSGTPENSNLLEQIESGINTSFYTIHELHKELDGLYKKYVKVSIKIAEELYDKQ